MKNNINRGEINSLNLAKKKGSLNPLNFYSNPTSSSGSTSGRKMKLQSMSKLLVNKIDDILGNPVTASYPIDHLANLNSLNAFTSNSTNDIPFNQAKINSTKSKEKKKKIKKKKDTFVTHVEIEGNPKSNYLEEHDKKIKAMLAENDDIDNLLQADEEKDYLASHPEHKEEVDYFKNLIREVDDVKRNMKNELDELQYLIKFVDDTKGRISRHKYGVSNMFSQTGLKKFEKREGDSDKEDDEDDAVYTEEGVYDKSKNLGRVKDRLFNMHGNVLNFYHNFNDNMKAIEKTNKDSNINRDLMGNKTSQGSKVSKADPSVMPKDYYNAKSKNLINSKANQKIQSNNANLKRPLSHDNRSKKQPKV